MKIEDLKIGHIYHVEYLGGGETENYSGPATYMGRSGVMYPEGSLEFRLSGYPYEGHFDIEDVKHFIGISEFRFVIQDFDSEIDRMKEHYLNLQIRADQSGSYKIGSRCGDMISRLETARRVVLNFVENGGYLDSSCLE